MHRLRFSLTVGLLLGLAGCGTGQVEPDPREDGGPADSDQGADAGPDAGPDAGAEKEPDAGTDAGGDLGPDGRDLTDPANAEALGELGYVNVIAFGADPTGARDSTEAIQAAIDEGYRSTRAVLFPLGTYLVSDTLRCYKWWLAGTPFPRGIHALVGENRDGRRPRVVLAPSAPRFDDGGALRPLVAFMLFKGAEGSAIPADPASFNPIEGLAGFTNASADTFDDQLRGIDLDCGGHPGAVGVYFPAAQKSLIADVRVDATGAHTGVWGIPGRNMGAVNLEVQGGRIGLRIAPSTAGATVVGLRLLDQTERAIAIQDFVPLVVVGFHIRHPGPTAVTLDATYATAAGTLVLIDGVLEVTGDGGAATIDNRGGRSLYLRNVYGNGPRIFVASRTGHALEGSGGWFRVAEYAYTDQEFAGREPTDDNHFQVFNLVEGDASQAPEPARVLEQDVGAPPDLVARHDRLALPQVTFADIGGTHVITEAPFGAVADDGRDDWGAIQAAIDASELDGKPVFVPKGVFHLSRPLVLGAGTRLVGVGCRRFAPGVPLTRLKAHASFGAAGEENALVRTVDAASAAPFLGFMDLEITAAVDRHLEWRAGHNSTLAALGFHGAAPRESIRFAGGGGGRVYLLEPKSPGTAAGHRSARIEGTREPLSWYGCNLEDQEGVAANLEIDGARNVRIYGIKREGRSPTLILRDSANVGVFGLGAMREGVPAGSGGYLQITGDSSQLRIALGLVQTAYGTPNGEPLLREALTGEPVRTIVWPDSLGLYGRGELDDARME